MHYITMQDSKPSEVDKPLDFGLATDVGDRGEVLHDDLGGLCLACATLTWWAVVGTCLNIGFSNGSSGIIINIVVMIVKIPVVTVFLNVVVAVMGLKN